MPHPPPCRAGCRQEPLKRVALLPATVDWRHCRDTRQLLGCGLRLQGAGCWCPHPASAGAVIHSRHSAGAPTLKPCLAR